LKTGIKKIITYFEELSKYIRCDIWDILFGRNQRVLPVYFGEEEN